MDMYSDVHVHAQLYGFSCIIDMHNNDIMMSHVVYFLFLL